MKYLIIFLLIFSIQTHLLASESQSFDNDLNNDICINDIVISSSSYKTEGQISYITVQIENLSDKEIYDIKLVLTSVSPLVQFLEGVTSDLFFSYEISEVKKFYYVSSNF